MKRALTAISFVALAPLLMGAGGDNPLPGTATISNKPTFIVNVQMDPHMAAGDPRSPETCGNLRSDVTSTAKQATIQLRDSRGNLLSQAQFKVLPEVTLYRGCDADLTNNRFGNRPLSDWIPLPTVHFLFSSQGIVVNESNVPVIVEDDIIASECIDDPVNRGPFFDGGELTDACLVGQPAPTALSAVPGVLLFEAQIKFCTSGCQ
jgi:hypothetical protein